MQPTFNAAASVVDQVNQVSSRLPGQMRDDSSGYEIPPSIPMPPSQSQVGFTHCFLCFLKFGFRCYLAIRAFCLDWLLVGYSCKTFFYPKTVGLLPVPFHSKIFRFYLCFLSQYCCYMLLLTLTIHLMFGEIEF